MGTNLISGCIEGSIPTDTMEISQKRLQAILEIQSFLHNLLVFFINRGTRQNNFAGCLLPPSMLSDKT
jgi:hypothetical protein